MAKVETKRKNGNLRIWDAVEKTDPAYTKQAAAKGFKCTAINPCYVTKKLTALFGPCGQGWKFVLIDQNFMQGHVLGAATLDTSTAIQASPATPAIHTVIHIVLGRIDYTVGDEWFQTGPQYGQTTFVGKNSKGIFTDEEAPKKSITDCLGKCAALLGVSADIYLGTWDSNKYINTPADVHVTDAKTTKFKTTRKKSEPAVLPDGYEDFTAADWDGFIENVEAPDMLLLAFNTFRTKFDNLVDLKLVCETTAQVARNVIKKKGSSEWKSIVEGLKYEKTKLDAKTVA